MRITEGKGGRVSDARQSAKRRPVLSSSVSTKQPLQGQLAGDERVEGFKKLEFM